MTNLLGNLGISGSAIIITVDSEEMVFRAGHNLPKIWTTPVNLLNDNDLLGRQSVVMTVDAARKVEEMWVAPLNHRQRRLAQAEATLMAVETPEAETLSAEATAAPPEAASESAEATAPPEAEGEAAAAPTPRRRRRTATPGEESAESESAE